LLNSSRLQNGAGTRTSISVRPLRQKALYFGPDAKFGAKIWSVDDDDQGHDNIDHSAMSGMKMN